METEDIVIRGIVIFTLAYFVALTTAVITKSVVDSKWEKCMVHYGVAHFESINGGPETRFVIEGDVER